MQLKSMSEFLVFKYATSLAYAAGWYGKTTLKGTFDAR